MAIEMDESQLHAWELFVAGKNVGLFGRAGCGKSTIMSQAIAHAQRTVGADRVAVMAWTTHAAGLIGGTTIHKFLAIGIAELPKEVILAKVRGNTFVRAKLRKVKVLFVDEVPQIAARWFAVLEYVLRQLAPPAKHALPWGGVQVVVAGDALQLGPVHRYTERRDAPVYMSRTFRDSFLSRYGALVFMLGSHRQSSSGWFLQCLDRIRTGRVTETDIAVLNATSDGVSEEQWASRTQLRALNKQVDEFNSERLANLPDDAVTYMCTDVVNPSLTHPLRVAYALSRMETLAPGSITLKPGASVLLTRQVDGVPSASQGMVERCLETHASCVFGGRRVDVPFASFDLIDNCGAVLASRHALPLVLAWAMTIHRAQGASLDSLAIDFSALRWREPGLAYSGLSRCRDFDDLFVQGLRREHIVVCEDAAAFSVPSFRA